jgi:hypothetical protein
MNCTELAKIVEMNPPATDAAIAQAQTALGYSLPDTYIELLKCSDGFFVHPVLMVYETGGFLRETRPMRLGSISQDGCSLAMIVVGEVFSSIVLTQKARSTSSTWEVWFDLKHACWHQLFPTGWPEDFRWNLFHSRSSRMRVISSSCVIWGGFPYRSSRRARMQNALHVTSAHQKCLHISRQFWVSGCGYCPQSRRSKPSGFVYVGLSARFGAVNTGAAGAGRHG